MISKVSKLIKVSDLSSLEKNSFVIGPFGSDLVQTDYRKSGVPVVFVRDVKRSRFNWISNIFLEQDKAEQLKAHSVKAGDIVITKMGLPPGIAAVYPTDMPEGVITADIIRLRPNLNLVDPIYLCELLNSNSAQKQVYERTAGQTRPKLTLSDYKTIKFEIPTLLEQRKIAQILSTWDQAISATEKLLENSQQQKKALMQLLLTGKKRLLDENGVRFSGEWKSTKVKEIFKPEVLSAGNQDFPIFSVTKNGLVNQSEYFNKSVASEDTSKYRVVKTGRFVMSGLNFWMGSVDVHLMDFPVIVSPAYKVFVITNLSSPEFMKHFIRSSLFQKVLEAASVVGASVVRRNFSESIFNSYELFIPEIAEQEKIAAVLSAADQEIEGLQKKLDCLKQEKKALMQQLLTGKKRVKVAA